MRRVIQIAEASHAVTLGGAREEAELIIDERSHRASLHPLGGGEHQLTIDDRCERVWIAVRHDIVYVHAGGRSWRLRVVDPREQTDGGNSTAPDLATAPMPARVESVAVAAGDEVRKGQALLVLESMKMQNEVLAWRDGIVKDIHVAPGETLDRGAWLVSLTEEG